MVKDKDFSQNSYESHGNWFEKKFPNEEIKINSIKNWLTGIETQSVAYWIHKNLFELANPLISKGTTWLTVGDGYGFDAHYFFEKGLKVVATDIGDAFLPLAKEHKLIDEYSIENVEKLSFTENAFDFVFCKEAYHHFPRPYLGVYEMIRVSKKAVIIIEPQDPLTKMPLMLFLKNVFDRFSPKSFQKLWKNRYSFEEVGNYVFKLSDREMEKLAMGMNLPAIAFKGINNNYYISGLENETANLQNKAFKKILFKQWKDDLMCKLGIKPHQVLSAIIFKEKPQPDIIAKLKATGYLYIEFPKNPYI